MGLVEMNRWTPLRAWLCQWRSHASWAITVVPPPESRQGFYSRYILVPKNLIYLIFTFLFKAHRKFLCFAFMGVAYKYQCLAFGYSLALCTFSKCMEAALEPLRRQGKRILFYQISTIC